MPRPCCPRKVRMQAQFNLFIPVSFDEAEKTPAEEERLVNLTLDELEAVRLADYEGLYQEAAARAMGVSRQTFGRILKEAHWKIAEVLLKGKKLRIEGGTVRPFTEEERNIKIAVPVTKEGYVDTHFGHCKEFALFETSPDGKILKKEPISVSEDCGCKSVIAALLAGKGVTILLSSGIGEGAMRVLAGYGIRVIRGVSGLAEDAVRKYLLGEGVH